MDWIRADQIRLEMIILDLVQNVEEGMDCSVYKTSKLKNGRNGLYYIGSDSILPDTSLQLPRYGLARTTLINLPPL